MAENNYGLCFIAFLGKLHVHMVSIRSSEGPTARKARDFMIWVSLGIFWFFDYRAYRHHRWYSKSRLPRQPSPIILCVQNYFERYKWVCILVCLPALRVVLSTQFHLILFPLFLLQHDLFTIFIIFA